MGTELAMTSTCRVTAAPRERLIGTKVLDELAALFFVLSPFCVFLLCSEAMWWGWTEHGQWSEASVQNLGLPFTDFVTYLTSLGFSFLICALILGC